MAFAGLWETWNRGETPIESFAIITTQANATVQVLHERMPVILPPKHFAAWLAPQTDRQALHEMLDPCPDEWLAFHPVDARVGNVKNDDAGLIEPLTDLFPA